MTPAKRIRSRWANVSSARGFHDDSDACGPCRPRHVSVRSHAHFLFLLQRAACRVRVSSWPWRHRSTKGRRGAGRPAAGAGGSGGLSADASARAPASGGSAVPPSSARAEPAFPSHRRVSSGISCATRPRVSQPQSTPQCADGGRMLASAGPPSPHACASLVGTVSFRYTKPPSHFRLSSKRCFSDLLVSQWRRR